MTSRKSPLTSEPGTRRESLLADLADLIMNVSREIRVDGPEDGGPIRLTMTESHVMRYVDRNPGVTPSRTAQATGVRRTNLSAALRALEQKGMVVLTRDEHDHRGLHVHPTELARQNVELLRARWTEQLSAALDDLDDELELDGCLRVLERLESGLVDARDPRPRAR